MKRIIVRVKPKHIKSGVTRSAMFCPIALAIKEQTGAASVTVGLTTCTIDNGNYLLSGPAIHFIQQFDRHEKVLPVRFALTQTP